MSTSNQEWKTLEDLWRENGEKAILVDTERNGSIHIVAMAPDGWLMGWYINTGYRCFMRSDVNAKLRAPEKKKVAHWPAIFKNKSGTWVGRYLFSSEDFIKCKAEFVRLATELPPIMLEVTGG